MTGIPIQPPTRADILAAGLLRELESRSGVRFDRNSFVVELVEAMSRLAVRIEMLEAERTAAKP